MPVGPFFRCALVQNKFVREHAKIFSMTVGQYECFNCFRKTDDVDAKRIKTRVFSARFTRMADQRGSARKSFFLFSYVHVCTSTDVDLHLVI